MESGAIIQMGAFVLGLVLGSFLNVVIARLPRGESIVHPPSRCPRCKKRIPAWDNIPVLSFVLLRGRCRHCKKAISWRYPIVELLSGLLLWLLVRRVDDPIVLVRSDELMAAYGRTIPDVVTIPGVGLGLAASLFGPPGLAGAALGALSGGVSLWLVGALYEKATGVAGMGGGDVKLAAMMGAFLGVGGVFGAIFLASLAGSIFGMLLIARGKGSRRTAIPFGTFLAPAAIALCLYGEPLFRFYRSFLH